MPAESEGQEPLQTTFVFLPSDAQHLLKNAGGKVLDHLPNGYEGGLWTAQFPETTQVDECYLWTPNRTLYVRYTLPDATILVKPQEKDDPHRSLFALTPQMQEWYSMSRKEAWENYPHTTMKDGVKEILVPGYRREADGSLFVSGFGAGRPGYTLLFVLFTYHPDGKREIYLLDCDDRDDPVQRYTHLREVIPAPNAAQPQIRVVACALDHQLKASYGIDWEIEVAAVAVSTSPDA